MCDETISILIKLFKEIREFENLTIEQTADIAGIHRTSLGLIERGERLPSISTASKISKALNYELSDLLKRATLIQENKIPFDEAIKNLANRIPLYKNIKNEDLLLSKTGITAKMLLNAIQTTYNTIDLIDDELIAKDLPPLSKLVELANLSSMLGNIIGGSLAESSNGLYERNKPHTFPDLIPVNQNNGAVDLELKMALEKNKPKGHLPKEGMYISFRYVLGNKNGDFIEGRDSRGDTAWIWEIKVGYVSEDDFNISNTAGDSGKTAVIKTTVFNKMPLVYFDPKYCPHKHSEKSPYPAFN